MFRIPYESRAQNAGADRCVNWYPERAGGKVNLLPRPGKAIRVSLPAEGKGVWSDLGGSRFYVVSNSRVYHGDNDSIDLLTGPAISGNTLDFATDGTNGVIVNGSAGYHSGNLGPTATWAQIVSANFQVASTVCFLDGYFIYTKATGAAGPKNEFFWCDLNTPLTFNALSTARANSCPDFVYAARTLNRRLYIMGSRTIEVWQNTGVNPDLPFERETVIPVGVYWALGNVVTETSIYFLGQTLYGHPAVYRLSDYVPVKVSTPAIDALLKSWSSPSAIRLTIEKRLGHTFIHVIPGSTAGSSLIYDEVEDAWHEESTFVSAAESGNKWIQCAYVPNGESTLGASGSEAGYHVWVGSYGSGVYQPSDTQFTDSGAAIYRRIAWPTDSPRGSRLRWKGVDVFCDTGVQTTPMSLGWSRDGGVTFDTEPVLEPASTSGERWMRWRGLGVDRGRVWQILDVATTKSILYDVSELVEEMPG